MSSRPYYGSCPPRNWSALPVNLTPEQPRQCAALSSLAAQSYFIDAAGKRVPINPWSPHNMHSRSDSGGEQPRDGEVEGGAHSIDGVVQIELNCYGKVQGDLQLGRAYRQAAGQHFGGYRPGKNLRQTLSIRHLGLNSGHEISQLFGLPIYELASAEMSLDELAEPKRQADWAATVAAQLYK